jgi:hypothetical protein
MKDFLKYMFKDNLLQIIFVPIITTIIMVGIIYFLQEVLGVIDIII